MHHEAKNPFDWPRRKKWILTWLATFTTFITNTNGTMITVAHEAINEAFHVSDATFPNSYWPVTSWALGGATFSLLVLPLFEDFGLRPGFLVTYGVLVCFIVPQALAQNFATLIVARFFSGGCVAILANATASIIGNIWQGEWERTIPMSLYITAYLAGISAGSVIGGVILQALGWRWISYMQVIWYGLFSPLYIFLLDETRTSFLEPPGGRSETGSTGGASSSRRRKRTQLVSRLFHSAKRPLYMLATEPVLFVFTLWSAFAVGTVYLFTQSVEQVFSGLYGFTASQAGYVQSASVIGICIGWVPTLVTRKFYFESAKYNKEIPGVPVPEARLYTSTVGSLLGLAAGMFVYAWTSYPNIPWVAPAIGIAMVGFGITTIVSACADYLVDAYAKYAGSAVAAVVLGELLVAAFLPLAAQSMYTDLGFQWASTTLGLFSLVISAAPFVLIKWGPRIRAQSPFMKEALIEAVRAHETADGVNA